MADEELRAKIIARAKEKVRNMKPLAILEAVTLLEYIEEIEAAQQNTHGTGLNAEQKKLIDETVKSALSGDLKESPRW